MGLSEPEIQQEYTDVFDGLGRMPGQVHLTVDQDAKPVIMPPCHVLIAIKPKLKAELQRLGECDVIENVTGPTDCASSMVNVVKPSGRL